MKPVRTLLIAAVCWLWMAAGQVCAQLRCEDSAVRLGQVKAGQPLFHRFTIINHGKDEARVTEVRPSCGCLRPRLDEHILRPGQQATLILEANTLTQPAGPNAWKVRIFYTCGNDEKRELALILFAEIVTEIQVLPPALVLHTSGAISGDIQLIDSRSSPLRVKELRTSSPELRAAAGPPHRDDTGRWVRTIGVRVLAKLANGRHDETLRIITSDPDYPDLRIPITVMKRAANAVSATPEEISLSAAAGEPLPSRLIRLRGGEERPVVVQSVECAEAAVRCTWAAGPGNMATLRVHIDRGQVPAGGLRTDLRVHVRSAGEAIITIPVSCDIH